jgi:hypothetical protein
VRGGSAKAQQEAQQEAAVALAHLARGNAENSVAIARAGAIEPLVALVRSGSAKTQQSLASSPSLAAATLTSLASSADTLAAYAQAHNLNPLIALSRDSTAGEDSAYLMAGLLHSLAANSVEIKRAINRAGGVGSQRTLIGGPAGVQERLADALHNLGSNILLTAVAGALLAYLVYSRRTAPARPRAKQVRRPEKEAAERRRRRQAGAAAEASHAGRSAGGHERSEG